jgi:adenylate cyclase class 2
MEIEVKVRVGSHDAVRQRLSALGAVCEGTAHETNTFFDTPDRRLLREDRGLRIRVNRRDNGENLVVTYKGPKTTGPSGVKSREEVEVEVGDHDALVCLMGHLGYHVTLSFDKRRETWRLPDAEVVLDTLPHLGTFVEVEAASETTVRSVLARLGLDAAPAVAESYIRLIAAWIDTHAPGTTEVRF